jgi:predicted nuclease with TOPRIM domain
MYKVFGITLREWVFIIFVVVLSILVIGMITAYYQNMEEKVIENETNIKWLQKENVKLKQGITSLGDSIALNHTEIGILQAKNAQLDIRGRAIRDSITKLKKKYDEIGKRVDTIDVDGIKRYFSELKR